MESISSKDNKKIKEARKWLTKKYRKNSYLIEGFHLLEEALKAGRSIKQIFVEENKLTKLTEMIGSEKSLTDLSVNLVSKEVLKSLADSESPQGLIAEVTKIEEVIDFSAAKFLVDAINFPSQRIPNKIFRTKLIIRESVKKVDQG